MPSSKARSRKPRPRSRPSRSHCGRPRTSFAPCWAFRPPTCRPDSGQRPIPTAPRRRGGGHSGAIAGAAARHPQRRTQRRGPGPANRHRPGRACIPTSRSPARWATRPRTPRNCSPIPRRTAASGRSFQWNILNYGRLANNVSLQDAKFQQTLLDYRTAVLTANQEAEDGLISFLRSQEQTRLLSEATVAADKAFQIGLAQYRVGTVDFNRLATLESTLVQSQISEAHGPRVDFLGPDHRLPGVGRRLGNPPFSAGDGSRTATGARARGRGKRAAAGAQFESGRRTGQFRAASPSSAEAKLTTGEAITIALRGAKDDIRRHVPWQARGTCHFCSTTRRNSVSPTGIPA